ncbi:MAG TPA: phosphatase PAP2 family protein [Thermoanaerobaculia bacterium]|nr:phosphatase PAP2 family protein [Thermoanaerobaculia bacterium]
MYISTPLPRPADRLHELELRIVEGFVAHARRRGLTRIARVVTRAGNGWLYSAAAALLLLRYGRSVAAAALSLAVAFLIYPPLKRFIARPRPCHAGGHLTDTLRPLDRYSFPSGHAMTAAAFGVPIAVAAPLPAALIVVAGCTLMSWSRMALGHHYLSDVVAGTILGGVIAAAVALLVLP